MKKYISTVAALLCAALVLVSCKKDDDKPAPPRNVTDVNGNYSGKMIVSPIAKKAVVPGADVKAAVKSDTVYIDSLPVKDIVVSIVGEEAADGIVAAIGKVSYQIGFTASQNTAKDSIALTLAPKPLRLAIPGLSVEVAIGASKPGMFSYAPEKLGFVLSATEVKVNGEPFDAFQPSKFSFAMAKN